MLETLVRNLLLKFASRNLMRNSFTEQKKDLRLYLPENLFFLECMLFNGFLYTLLCYYDQTSFSKNTFSRHFLDKNSLGNVGLNLVTCLRILSIDISSKKEFTANLTNVEEWISVFGMLIFHHPKTFYKIIEYNTTCHVKSCTIYEDDEGSFSLCRISFV